MTTYQTIAPNPRTSLFWINTAQKWKVAESYQSESDLERELIQDLQNQGYISPA